SPKTRAARRPLHTRLSPIKEHKLQRIFKLQVGRRASHFKEPRCARTPVACANKWKIKKLRVVVTGQCNDGWLRASASRTDVHHFSKTAGSPGVKGVQLRFQSCLLQLCDDIG